ncbi:MAG: hypothetical protein PHR77_14030 [Kiritimatiellae bacterium]|nr:hypothetical protein [Kiritimatiellia bacterium]MDD5522814.1 hypothetical protein [Kiritimatiellia bacterium]
MTSKTKQHSLSRRLFLGSIAGGAALSLIPGSGHSAESVSKGPSRSTVRDRFWIFTVFAGGDNDYLERGGIRGGSRMTPAEGAFYLNVPNLLLIRSHEHPKLPGSQSWRTKTEFDQYAYSFRSLDRVIWSVVGSGGKGGMSELYPVLALAKKFPNISGIYLDDFIIDAKKQPNGQLVGKPALQPVELSKAREQMKSTGRPMDVWVTLYTHEINPPKKTTSPGYRGCEPPLADFLDMFDVLTLWTWNSDELVALDENLAELEKIAPKKARIALGMYIWDYHNSKPVPVDLMKHQCESGLKWLKEGRIHEMIFLANTVLDVGLESAEFAREWIARVGSQALPEKRPTGN